MMKDRLSELKQGAVFTISDDEEEENGVLVENDINEENSKVYNFLKEVEEVRSCISRIQECSLCVKKKQSEILSAPMAENKTKEEMQQAMAGITPIANQIRSKLANMKTRIEQTEEDASRCGDIRIHKSQYSTLSRSFIAVMTEYNATQNDYRDRCKARIQRQLQITGRQVDDEELENMLENSREDNSVGIFTCSMTMDTQQSKQALNEIESRHNDIMQLEKNIKELHGLFLDMAVMVEQQGEMVNLIEHSVNGASEYVATAAVEINDAVELQSKARKKTICVVVIVVVVVVVLIIVIATTV